MKNQIKNRYLEYLEKYVAIVLSKIDYSVNDFVSSISFCLWVIAHMKLYGNSLACRNCRSR